LISLYLIAAFFVFLFRWLLSFILMFIMFTYFSVSWLFLHILLNNAAVLVLSTLCIVLLRLLIFPFAPQLL